jgi:signal transduction histidine kinase
MRLTLRTRLTLIYGSLFLITGTALLVMTYLLAAGSMNRKFTISIPKSLLAEDPATGPPFTGALPVERMVAVKSSIDQQITQQKSDVLHQLVQSSLLAMLALGLLAVVLAYVVAGRALAPLQHVTATARKLSESTLHERIALEGPRDEIKELADTFDDMLDRLHRAFDAQRRFVANASHELRTPLTINRTVLEVALASRRTSEETRVLARRLLGNTARHERLIEGLLLLARSERELITRTPVSLHETVITALEQLTGPAREAEVDITTEPGPAVVSGDPVLLERCAVNLVENAIKYNRAGGMVLVRTGTEGDTAVLRVDNTGPPVPPHEMDGIFEPFRRLRADRIGSSHGAGLGLSIVRAVVAAHDGRIEAAPRRGGGLVVTLRFPAARQR